MKKHIDWVDCRVLMKKMCEAQIHMNEYTSRKFQEEGLHNDQFLTISLIELKQRIDRILEEKKILDKV